VLAPLLDGRSASLSSSLVADKLSLLPKLPVDNLHRDDDANLTSTSHDRDSSRTIDKDMRRTRVTERRGDEKEELRLEIDPKKA